jgi:hypothetical protein
LEKDVIMQKITIIGLETEGHTISKPVRGAIRFATRRISHELHQLGLNTGAVAYRSLETTPATAELENL